MTRLLIECTYVFEHPADNSGIQRVVRNIIRELPNIAAPVECVPVIMRGGAVYRVLALPLATALADIPLLRRVIAKLSSARDYIWYWYPKIERTRLIRASRNLRRVLFLLCRVASLGISLPLRGLLFWEERAPDLTKLQRMELSAGDQLVLLDSSWHADFFPLAERLKANGVGIVSVIYDLIPLTHPQFCDAGLVKVFNTWFDWIARNADGYIAISKTISDQARTEIELRLGKEVASTRWHEHFRLGSDLDLAREAATIDRDIVRVFSDGAAVYLAVSTIEPRKNHTYLLDAFEILWSQGCTAKLCIVGKIGWKCDDLVTRIRQHAELNKRLFMCNGVDDSSLEFAYKSARALLFPSFVEGFGLPLVEAMQRGLPAMASDIPVFREVGGEFLAYFDLENPNSLVEQIDEFERTNKFPAARDIAEWRWPGWREASQQFVEKVLAGLNLEKAKQEQANLSAPNNADLFGPTDGYTAIH